MSNFGDDFRVSNYIKPLHEFVDERKNYVFGSLSYTSYEVEQAKQWAKDTLWSIIYPVPTLEELEKLWFDFSFMITDKRMKSDDKSVELFGVPNQFHYELLKSEFLKENIENPDIESVQEAAYSDGYISISYTPADIKEANDWIKRSGYPMIRPCNSLKDLEDLWTTFMSYPIYARNKSDDMSIKIFGVKNATHYNYLKSKYVHDDLDPESDEIDHSLIEESFIGDAITSHRDFNLNENVDVLTKAEDLLGLISRYNENYDDAIITDIVNKSTDAYVMSNQNFKYDAIPFEDLPFFTPEEMIDFGVGSANPEDNFYGVEPITNILSEDMKDWFERYCEASVGYTGNYDALAWKNSLRKLYLKREFAEDPAPYNQAILNLGWPPEAEFTPENQVLATKRLKSKLCDDMNGSVQFVDLTGMQPGEINEAAATAEDTLYPVFIVLEEGKTLMSAAIKKVTGSTYSHAAISFDPSMETMYSYGIEGSENGIKGGFIKENVKDKDLDRHMAIFAIFLKKEDWQKLKDIIEDFAKNIGKTSYSYINLLVSHIFKIPMNMDKKMVCSQFVDKVLKLVDIDISKKNSSLVNPADFEKYAKENKKIYILFDDFVAKFKPFRIKGLVTKLSKKADPIKEQIFMTDSLGIVFEMMNNIRNLSALQEISSKINLNEIDPRAKKIYETMVAPCLEAEVYVEAKNLPLQLDKWGNLYLNGIRKMTPEECYRESHDLLKAYSKKKNIDGMKYELFKIYGLKKAIDRRLKNKKLKEEERKELIDTRARVINDYEYYLDFVLDLDPKFNFSKEFKKSPFDDENIRITNNTIKWTSKALKSLFTNL